MTIAGMGPETALARLQQAIAAYVRDSPLNRLSQVDGGPIFAAPLVGVADGDDPLWQRYQGVIGAFHLTPREALSEALGRDAGAEDDPPQALRVVSWILPFSERVRASNRAEDVGPSQHWAHARHDGERFNDALRGHMEELLRGWGHAAIAPVRLPSFAVHREGTPTPPAASWSERHVAYAAGLGTFGLSDGLITPVGMAMRCGSVVTDAPLPVSPRPYADHTAYCLFLAEGSCGVCIARCPAGAITRDGHDKARCAAYIDQTLEPLRRQYGVAVAGCGLCQVGVPCEGAIPLRGTEQ